MEREKRYASLSFLCRGWGGSEVQQGQALFGDLAFLVRGNDENGRGVAGLDLTGRVARRGGIGGRVDGQAEQRQVADGQFPYQRRVFTDATSEDHPIDAR